MSVKQMGTTPYTVTANDDTVIFVNNTAKVAFLPNCALLPPGHSVSLVNQATPGTVTVVPNGSQLIDGEVSLVISVTSSVMLMTDGLNWYSESKA